MGTLSGTSGRCGHSIGTRCNTQGDPAPCGALPVEKSMFLWSGKWVRGMVLGDQYG
jgi:hypothetical protein